MQLLQLLLHSTTTIRTKKGEEDTARLAGPAPPIPPPPRGPIPLQQRLLLRTTHCSLLTVHFILPRVYDSLLTTYNNRKDTVKRNSPRETKLWSPRKPKETRLWTLRKKWKETQGVSINCSLRFHLFWLPGSPRNPPKSPPLKTVTK